MAQTGNTFAEPSAAAALACSQSELILNCIRDAVIMTDLNGVVTYWNAAATALFGWRPEEVLGRPYIDRYPPERRDWIAAQIGERALGMDWDGEYEDLRKDGSTVWIRSLVRRVEGPDGQLAGILGVSQDITPAKQAQKTAQAQAALERAVLDSMAAHIAVLDAQGLIRAVNRAWGEFARQNAPPGLDHTPNTGVGVNYLDVWRPCGDDSGSAWADARSAIIEVLAGKRRSYSVEYPCHAPQARHWFRMTVTPLDHADGGAVIAHTDITDRVVSETRSRQDSELLQLALAAARMGVWSLDLSSRQLTYSPEVGEILRRANFSIDPKDLCSVLHPDDSAAMNQALDRCVAEQGHFEGTFRIVRRDGLVRWLHNFAEFQRGRTGVSDRVVGTLQDVSVRRAVHVATLHRSQILRQIAQGAPLPDVLADIVRMLEDQFPDTRAAILLYEPQHNSLHLAASLSLPAELRDALASVPALTDNELLCTAGAQAQRAQHRDLTADDTSSVYRALAARCGMRASLSLPLRSGTQPPGKDLLGVLIVYGLRDRDPSGSFQTLVETAESLFAQSASRDPLADEEAVAASSVGGSSKVLARALTLAVLAIERQRDLRDLKVSEERFRLLIEGMRDHAVYLVDKDYRVLTWNAAATRMFGYSALEIVGQESFTLLRAEDTSSAQVQEWNRRMQQDKRLEVEGWLLRKDGSLFWGTTISSPIFESTGDVSGYVIVTRDLTEKRRLEGQLRQAQRMDAVGRLAGGLAHDFNNLLLIIRGYADLLFPRLSDNAMDSEAILAIRDAVERAGTLTRQRLAFSSTAVVAPKILDLNSIVTAAGRSLSRLLGDDVRLSIQLDPQLGPIRLDPTQLDQMLLNLGLYARAAMPSGGTLLLETCAVTLESPTHLDFGLLKPGLYAQLLIRDSGRGIPEESRLHLFEPFYGDGSQGGGRGLGLATVYGIVRQAGGAISVISEINQGTEFRILLPMLLPTLRPVPAPPSALPQGRETLLVLEEEDSVRQIVRITLQMLGYRVLVAATYREAIEMAANHRGAIDSLVLDVGSQPAGQPRLPDVLRADQPRMKVLYLSTQAMQSPAWNGPEAPALLRKPFTPQALASKLRELLDGS